MKIRNKISHNTFDKKNNLRMPQKSSVRQKENQERKTKFATRSSCFLVGEISIWKFKWLSS